MGAPQYEQAGADVAGSGTPDTIPRWTGATTLGDSPLTVSGNNVTGAGAIRATGTTAGAPAFTGADTDTGVYFPAANQMRFSTAGSPAMSIDATQQVGIGTTSPGYRLDVAVTAGVSSGAALSISAGAGNDIARWTANTATGEILFGQGRAAAGNYFLTFYTVGAERARIDSSGNVVINTAAIATNATNGFLYVPSCAGTPTGTPTTYTGRVPIVVDTTNNKLYFYSGGSWRDAGP